MNVEHHRNPWPHYRISSFFGPDEFPEVLALAKATTLDRTNPERYGALRHWGLCGPELSSLIVGAMRSAAQELPMRHGYMSPRVLRDLPGHKIDPHPDTRRKVATLQVYLEGPPDHGTVLMSSSTPHPGDERLEFRPNAGIFFRRTDYTWHRIDVVKAERWSLQVPFFRTRGET